MPGCQHGIALALLSMARKPAMLPALVAPMLRRACLGGLLAGALSVLAGCSGTSDFFGSNPFGSSPPPPAAPQQPAAAIGAGEVRVALILPLSAAGNAGVAAQS